ncbi:hypothetical protein GGS21DRAFT_8928 [Xylaria nigripes]|nr:hypothetical protein GGS21DRAFT_8928 [Xylaria nigripes]
MHRSTILAALCGVSAVLAAPTWPHVNWGNIKSDGHDAISEYFNLLAEKITASKFLEQAPVCDLSKAKMPTGPTIPLPAPASDLRLAHVAIGRGTQNYTCDAGNKTAAPTAVGAVATLFNASCIASAYPEILNILPSVALHFALPYSASTNEMLGPTNMLVSGKHYFTDPTTPFFNVDMGPEPVGETSCTKLNSTDAPSSAHRGLQGDLAVPWLYLGAKSDATGGLRDVYRVNTVGGSAPATCEGMPASFEMQYAAEYWFFSS